MDHTDFVSLYREINDDLKNINIIINDGCFILEKINKLKDNDRFSKYGNQVSTFSNDLSSLISFREKYLPQIIKLQSDYEKSEMVSDYLKINDYYLRDKANDVTHKHVSSILKKTYSRIFETQIKNIKGINKSIEEIKNLNDIYYRESFEKEKLIKEAYEKAKEDIERRYEENKKELKEDYEKKKLNLKNEIEKKSLEKKEFERLLVEEKIRVYGLGSMKNVIEIVKNFYEDLRENYNCECGKGKIYIEGISKLDGYRWGSQRTFYGVQDLEIKATSYPIKTCFEILDIKFIFYGKDPLQWLAT